MLKIDTETYNKLKSGDPQAHRLVYERYRNRIQAFCYRMTTDQDVAADLTQDVFVKVLDRIGTLENPQALSAWLFAIARNEVYAFFRRSRENRPFKENDVWESETPIDTLVASERSTLIRALVDRLQPAYREAILLREFEGLSYAEIAKVTGSTEAAIKARLFKARQVLVKKLTPLFGEE